MAFLDSVVSRVNNVDIFGAFNANPIGEMKFPYRASVTSPFDQELARGVELLYLMIVGV